MPHCPRNIVKSAVLLALALPCLAPTTAAFAQTPRQLTASLGQRARFLLPDLVIADWDVVTLRPLDTGVALPVNILELTVKNTGVTSAPASHTHVRFVSHRADATAKSPKVATVLETSALAPGASVIVRIAIPAPPQVPDLIDFGFVATADAGPNAVIESSEILERSETNNSLAVTLQTF
jgi:hypothetical protein